MSKYKTYYLIFGTTVGFILAGLGWAMGNYYLVAAGVVILAAGVSTMTMPTPTIF
jgi:hypothetical protein